MKDFKYILFKMCNYSASNLLLFNKSLEKKIFFGVENLKNNEQDY